MPPYSPGDEVVWLSVEAEGVRVQRSTVLEIEPEAPDRWTVRTDHGSEIVDAQGVGNVLLPMDDEIATELYATREGFVVAGADQEHSWEEDRDRGHDRGGWGW